MHGTNAWISGVCGYVCVHESVTKRRPELESQSTDSLGPDVLGFLSACNGKLNGMSVVWFVSGEFFNIVLQM